LGGVEPIWAHRPRRTRLLGQHRHPRRRRGARRASLISPPSGLGGLFTDAGPATSSTLFLLIQPFGDPCALEANVVGRECDADGHPIRDPSPRATPDLACAAASSPHARLLQLVCPQGCTGHSMQPCLTLHLARRPKGENPLERPPWGGAAQVDRERRPPSYGGRRGLAAWAACGGLPPGAKLQYGQHQREATSAPGSAGRARAFGRATMRAGAARINSRHAHVR
jgi:hypothetical protein